MGFENGHLLRLTLRASNGALEQINTFHYDLNDHSASPGSDPQTLADLFRDNVRPGWAAFYNSSWTIDPVKIIDEFDPQNPTALRHEWTSGASIPGTSTTSGDLLPSFAQILVTLRTANIGKRFRGRLWLGGSRGESEQANGTWGSTFLAGVATFLATIPHQPDLVTGVSLATADWCVYSRTQRAQNLDPYAPHITTATARALVHSLRRRAQY